MLTQKDVAWLENMIKDILKECKELGNEYLYEASELWWVVCRNRDADGSWYCNTYKAEEDIAEHFHFWVEFYNEYISKINEVASNILSDPETNHLILMEELYRQLFELMIYELKIAPEDEITGVEFASLMKKYMTEQPFYPEQILG